MHLGYNLAGKVSSLEVLGSIGFVSRGKKVILLRIFTERKKGCRLSELDAEVGANKQQLEIPLDVVADIPTKVDASVSWMPARGGFFPYYLGTPYGINGLLMGFPMDFCKMRLLKYWRFLNRYIPMDHDI